MRKGAAEGPRSGGPGDVFSVVLSPLWGEEGEGRESKGQGGGVAVGPGGGGGKDSEGFLSIDIGVL